MTTVYDSVTAADIPTTAEAVMGYVDGAFAWSPADWARFPGAAHVTITVTGKPGARLADVENGDLTPASGALWAKAEKGAGRRPSLYFSASLRPQIDQALEAQGLVSITDVDLFGADWTGEPHLLEGYMGTQYASPDHGSGGHYDLSVAGAGWLGIVVPPPPPPVPAVPPFPGRLLEVASPLISGADVRTWQGRMAQRGWNLGPHGADGVYGNDTAGVCGAFQRQKGLRVDRIVGPITWAAAWTAPITS